MINEMKKTSIIWGLLLLLIFGMLTAFGILWKKKNMEYVDAEKKISDLVKSYKDASTVATGETIPLKELQDLDLIDELKVNDETCDGYVRIENKKGVYEYKGYISCANYSTKGY